MVCMCTLASNRVSLFVPSIAGTIIASSLSQFDSTTMESVLHNDSSQKYMPRLIRGFGRSRGFQGLQQVIENDALNSFDCAQANRYNQTDKLRKGSIIFEKQMPRLFK